MKTICLHIFRYIRKRSFPEVSLVMRIKAMRNAAENNCMCTEVTDWLFHCCKVMLKTAQQCWIIHHFLLLEGIKYFLLSTSKSPSSKCCCYSRNFNAAFSLWNSLVVMKSPVLAVAVYPQYMILPCAAKGLQQTYRWNEGSMTRWLSQQLLACCLKTLPQSTILFYVILFIYLPFFSFTDFYRHNSHAICHLWHCSSPGCDPAAN